ncbi:MAG: hypothetical protein D3910_07190 [Candidatus Electrothrix sp. ATG2]|nr:hypothetical protein [Candidatus Electrothrix sp. ATG2]
MKNSVKFVLVFLVGALAGVCAMSFFAKSVTEEKANSYYAIGLQNIEKDTEKAILMFVYSSTLKPGWYAPHLGMAQCFEKKKDYASAIQEYNKAISLREESATALYENEKISKTIERLKVELDNQEIKEGKQ